MTNSPTTVREAVERIDRRHDWLADVQQTADGGWMLLFAPASDPSEGAVDEFYDDLEYVLDAEDIGRVTEIGNGWLVSVDEDGDSS